MFPHRLQTARWTAGALAVLFFGGFPQAAQPAPEIYSVDPAHTFPHFEISHLGFSRHRGRFNSTAGRLVLDREARRGSIEISIDAASIDTGDGKLEAVLKSDSFFDVEHHPKLLYRSAAFYFVEDQLIAVEGELTLRGVTRPVRLDVDHFHCGIQFPGLRRVCGANATARFLRSDFGMGKYTSFGLGDEVLVTIQIEAKREAGDTPPAVEPPPTQAPAAGPAAQDAPAVAAPAPLAPLPSAAPEAPTAPTVPVTPAAPAAPAAPTSPAPVAPSTAPADPAAPERPAR